MTSIFDLSNDINELPKINQGIINYRYRQISAIKGITDASFAQGLQRYKWSVPRNEWWVPVRSHFRFRGRLYRTKVGAGNYTPLTVADGIAPAMGFMASLYQSGRIKLNQNDISKIDDYFSQIDALETRKAKSKSWLDGIGATLNFWNADFTKRMNDVSDDGFTNEKNEIPLTVTYDDSYQYGLPSDITIALTAVGNIFTFASATSAIPDIGQYFNIGDTMIIDRAGTPETYTIATLTSPIAGTFTAIAANLAAQAYESFTTTATSFNAKSRRLVGFEIIWTPPFGLFKIDHALPLGEYEIVLSPQTSTNYKLRAIESLVAKTPVTHYDLEIDSMFFYAATMTAGNISDGQYLIDLDETVCNPKSATSTSSNNTYEVSPSTYAITVAFQDDRAGSATNRPISLFKLENDAELSLRRLQVNYAGEDKPIPTGDPEFVGTGTDHRDWLNQRYVDTMLYNGRYFDTGSAESLSDWYKRGAYYFFPWPKDGSDTSTTVTVRYGFNAAVANSNMLLFNHLKKVAIVTISGSQVVKVELHDR